MSTPPQRQLPEDLQKRKNEADVAKAEADARSAAAAARKAEVGADSAAATARRDQVKALVPDLGTVKDSTLDVKDATPMWGTLLTFGALKSVAARIATTLVAKRADNTATWRFLVTSDQDLASPDTAFREIATGLDQLISASDKLLRELQAEAPATARERGLTGTPLDAVEGLASALPAVLSLLSAHRTVSTGATVAGDLAAAAAVAGALREAAPDVSIVHDDFRLSPSGGIYDRVTAVSERRESLVARKLQLSDQKSQIDADLALAKAAKPHDQAEIQRLAHASTDTATRLGLVDGLLSTIDGFLATIKTIPARAKRSSLATAALHDGLHGDSPYFTHVLLVKAEAGQTQQQLDNRPFFFKDKFSTLADISITYVLIETGASTILEAGTITGTASAHGNLGSKPAVDAAVVG